MGSGKLKNERASLKMIADMLGTSECTVSKALHNKPKVSEAMRQKVLALAEQLNYRPNIIARSMVRHPLKAAVIYPEVWPSYYENIICGVFERARELQDYRVEVNSLHYKDFSDCAGCIRSVRLAAEEKCDAVILMTGTFLPQDRGPLSSCLQEIRCPVLLLGGGMVPDCPLLCHVRQNSFLCGQVAGNLALQLLSNKGHAAIVIGSRELEDHRMKSAGFINSLAGSEICCAGAGESFDEYDGAYRAAAELFEKDPEIDLLYVGTENIAGILAFLEGHDLAGKVKIIATGESVPVREALADGRVLFTLDENLKLQGRMAMDKLFQKLLQSQNVESQVMIDPSIKEKYSLLQKHL